MPGPREAEAIRILAEEARHSNRGDWRREAATRTDGLPVCADIGAILVLRPDGTVLSIDNNSGEIQQVREEGWILVARQEAAHRHPELKALEPQRPPGAKDCGACKGRGVVTEHAIRCGECWGMGWRA